jgi:hypothetical protein
LKKSAKIGLDATCVEILKIRLYLGLTRCLKRTKIANLAFGYFLPFSLFFLAGTFLVASEEKG